MKSHYAHVLELRSYGSHPTRHILVGDTLLQLLSVSNFEIHRKRHVHACL